MPGKPVSILELVNNSGCFDLQFRKDTRHKRTNSPAYYRWVAQFVITAPPEDFKTLKKACGTLGCGNVYNTESQARFCVQNINDIYEAVVPYFKKNTLAEKKKKDFDLWQKAVGIIYNNKGKPMLTWKKSDLLNLIQIQKLALKYKESQKPAKWIATAETFARTLKSNA